jgi:hypothetical protein
MGLSEVGIWTKPLARGTLARVCTSVPTENIIAVVPENRSAWVPRGASVSEANQFAASSISLDQVVLVLSKGDGRVDPCGAASGTRTSKKSNQ